MSRWLPKPGESAALIGGALRALPSPDWVEDMLPLARTNRAIPVGASVASKPRAEPLLLEFPDFITRAMRGDYLELARANKAKLSPSRRNHFLTQRRKDAETQRGKATTKGARTAESARCWQPFGNARTRRSALRENHRSTWRCSEIALRRRKEKAWRLCDFASWR